ncbi:glutathione S-transferase 1-like [Rhipicephalus sanguineus]|uniref:glutathione S-transferase 1-like n=1 Tax=Rhipicephalus sanguineus TaxID=34632 RepID=UPI001894C4B4|nr:glutathione S-transferase 1-like [Rhipicephalus sanguineus]
MTITLYNILSCPPCNFVRALAKHVGIELKTKNLDAYKKEHYSDEYLKINPFHKAPAIEDEDFVVYESNAIAYYLLRKYAPESELYPTCIQTRTRIDQILAAIATTIHNAQMEYTRPMHLAKKKPTTQQITTFEENYVKGLEHLIGDGKFAAGDTFTLADIALTTRVVVALENFTDPSKFPKLASYYDRVKRQQPYFEEVLAICYYLLRKHAPDTELYPPCIKTRARIDQALATIFSTIQPRFIKFLRPRIYELKHPTSEEVEKFEKNVIKAFEHMLADGKYFLGDRLSLADLNVVGHQTRILEVPFVDAEK